MSDQTCSFVVFLSRAIDLYLQLLDAHARGLRDRDFQHVVGETVALFGKFIEHLDGPAADRRVFAVEVLGRRVVYRVEKLLDADGRVDEVGIVSDVLDVRLYLVALVVYLAEDLLEDVLEREYAHRAAELVDDYRHLTAPALEFEQYRGDVARLVDEDRRREDGGYIEALLAVGEDGLDEITLTGKSYIVEVRNGVITELTFDPKAYGFEYCTLEDLVGGDPKVNAEIALKILHNENSPRRDAVLLNAGLAIYVALDGISIAKGIEIARETLESGKALEVLNNYIKLSNE